MQPDPRFWNSRSVCVTGGTGFLGFHLVQQLLALGARVRVLALPPHPQHPLYGLPQVETVFGDVCRREVVREAVADCDAIFHTAGIVAFAGPALRRMHAVHVGGTEQVLNEAPPQARIVHTSSVVAIGATTTLELLDEDSEFNLAGLRVDYVQAKRAAEQLALAAAQRGQAVLVVNPAYLVGPEDHERSELGRFCSRFWKGRNRLALPGGFNFVDVRDVAAGHLLAAEHGQPGRRYLLGGENHTMPAFCRLLAQAAGQEPSRLWPMPGGVLTLLAALTEARARLLGKKAHPALQQVRLNRWHWFYRSERARRELGYAPRSLAASVADAYRWHIERHLTQVFVPHSVCVQRLSVPPHARLQPGTEAPSRLRPRRGTKTHLVTSK
jgi:dihydroflavonol-4-reductase